MLPRSLRHRAPLLWILLPMMAGIVCGKMMSSWVNPWWPVGAGTISLVLAWRLRLRPFGWSAAFCSAIFLLSAAYFELRDHRSNALAESPPSECTLHLKIEHVFLGSVNSASASKRVSGIGRIVDESRVTIGKKNPSRFVPPTALSKGVLVSFSGRVSPKESNAPLRSSIIAIRGRIEPIPQNPVAHSFDEYLQSTGVTAKLSQGRVIGFDQAPSRYAKFCETLRLEIGRILGLGLGQRSELAAENRALFLGEVGGLGDARKRLFVETGTLHFFAIDGLHIAAVAVALHILFGVTRCPKSLSFAVTAIALWLYADLTGRSPSAVRAVLTVLFFEGAYLLRRPINPLAGLSASAMIALLLSPRELFGASFQMSYGIVAGLLLLGLPLAEQWQTRWTLFRHLPRVSWRLAHHSLHALHRHLLSGMAIGIATGLVADICGVQFFQLYSPVSILANLVLIPAASFALWANFCAAICGLAHISWLASVFNHAAALILLGMDKAIQCLVRLPWAVLPRQFPSMDVGFALIAALIGSLLFGYAARWSWRFGAWLPPVAITVFALVFLSR